MMRRVPPTLERLRRVTVVLGTRPEAVKLAPVILAMQGSSTLSTSVLVTGQHQEIADEVLSLFGIVIDEDLAVMRPGQALVSMLSAVVTGTAAFLGTTRSDLVLVQGDTVSSLAAALAAFYCGVPVAHLEAGLRTGNPQHPWPEEITRRLTTDVASLHLAPTEAARRNLLAEGVARDAIVVTGNTVVDALLHVARQPSPLPAAIEDAIGGGAPIVLTTAHRRESWGEGIDSMTRALARIATVRPDVRIVFPMHPNPIVREAAHAALSGLGNVILSPPLRYVEFVTLLARCTLVLTDSGGIQEEAPSLGKPVLVMRDVTERPEAIDAGTARLVGTRSDRIVSETLRLLDDPAAVRAMTAAANPFGDGRAAARCVQAIGHFFRLVSAPDEFRSYAVAADDSCSPTAEGSRGSR